MTVGRRLVAVGLVLVSVWLAVPWLSARAATGAATATRHPVLYGVGPGGLRWTARLTVAQGADAAAVVVAGDLAYVVSEHYLTAVSTRDGSIRWSRGAPVNDPATDGRGGGVFLDGPDLFVLGAHTVIAVNRRTGRLHWVYRIGASDSIGSAARVGRNGLAYVHTPGPVTATDLGTAVALLDLRTGRKVWDHRREVNQIESDGTSLIALAPTASDSDTGIDPRSGRTAWTLRPLDQQGQLLSNHAYVARIPSDAEQGAAFLPATLFAVDARTGRRLWTTTNSPYVPMIAAGGTLLAEYATGLAGLDARTGRVLFRHDYGPGLGGFGNLASALSTRAGNVFAFVSAGRALGVDVRTGRVRWQQPLPHPPASDHGTVGAASATLLLPYAGGGCLALDTATGRKLWQASVPGLDDTVTALADGDQAVLVDFAHT